MKSKSPCLTCEKSGEDKNICSKDCKALDEYRTGIFNPITQVGLVYESILNIPKEKLKNCKGIKL